MKHVHPQRARSVSDWREPVSDRREPGFDRRGFTLVELLVVIAIIAILAGLIVGATMRVIGTQSQKSTQLLVAKIATALNQQWMAVVDQANKEPEDYFTTNNWAISNNNGTAILNAAGGDAQRARILWVKLRLCQQFPESFNEALSPGGGLIAADPYYSAALAGAPALQPNQQQAVCLALALKNSTRGSVFNVDNLSPREIMTIPGTSLQYIMDDWKAPLQFTKFQGWSNPDLNPNGAVPGPPNGTAWMDPVDPVGKLSSTNWNGTATLGAIGYPYTSGQSYYLIPYVWSTGGPSQQAIVSYKSLIGGYNQ
jgi:prepilin-type N-terminal cleavage/methylation domain-containing protein